MTTKREHFQGSAEEYAEQITEFVTKKQFIEYGEQKNVSDAKTEPTNIAQAYDLLEAEHQIQPNL